MNILARPYRMRILFSFLIVFGLPPSLALSATVASCPDGVVYKNFANSSGAISNILKFSVVTDLHFGTEDNEHVHNLDMNNDIGRKFAQTITALGKSIGGLNGVVETGDITDFGKASQLQDYQSVWEDSTAMPYPVYVGLGNHDSRGIDDDYASGAHNQLNALRMKQYVFNRMSPGCATLKGVVNSNMDKGTMDCINKNINVNDPVKFDWEVGLCTGIEIGHAAKDTVNYSWDWGPIHFVQLHSVFNNSSYFTAGGADWLANDLQANASDGRPVILFQHYGFDSFSSTWWSDGDRTQFENIISNYNVVGIFTGHDHAVGQMLDTGTPAHDTFIGSSGGKGGTGGFYTVELDLTNSRMYVMYNEFAINTDGTLPASSSFTTTSLFVKDLKLTSTVQAKYTIDTTSLPQAPFTYNLKTYSSNETALLSPLQLTGIPLVTRTGVYYGAAPSGGTWPAGITFNPSDGSIFLNHPAVGSWNITVAALSVGTPATPSVSLASRQVTINVKLCDGCTSASPTPTATGASSGSGNGGGAAPKSTGPSPASAPAPEEDDSGD